MIGLGISALLLSLSFRFLNPFYDKINSAKSPQRSFTVYRIPNRLVLTKDNTTLFISQKNEDVNVVRLNRPASMKTKSVGQYDAVYGFFNLPLGSCVAVVKKSRSIPVATIPGLREVQSLELIDIPCNEDPFPPVSEDDENRHSEAKQLLLRTLRRQRFFFSTGEYEPHRSFQSNCLGDRCDKRDNDFFWNRRSVEPLFRARAHDFVVPMTSGLILSHNLTFENTPVCLTFIARRSKQMQGTRYLRRGGEENGNVANFVETEQILQRVDGTANTSFLQIRGSIPLRWGQPKSYFLRPPIELLLNTSINREVLKAHYRKLADSYGLQPESSLMTVNLIDRKGGQGMLGLVWEKLLSLLAKQSTERKSSDHDPLCFQQQKFFSDLSQEHEAAGNKSLLVQSVIHDLALLNRSVISVKDFCINGLANKHIWLDYHHLCHNHDILRLADLYPFFRVFVGDAGFFSIQNHSSKNRYQTALIRTNCLDCLDRTNVVQSIFSRWMLINQMREILPSVDISSSSSSLSLLDSELEATFRRSWTELGDFISQLYAGSRAMKRDVTQSGSRTSLGMLEDLFSFSKRYFVNNYLDETTQKGVDIVVGHKSESIVAGAKTFGIHPLTDTKPTGTAIRSRTVRDLLQNEQARFPHHDSTTSALSMKDKAKQINKVDADIYERENNNRT